MNHCYRCGFHATAFGPIEAMGDTWVCPECWVANVLEYHPPIDVETIDLRNDTMKVKSHWSIDRECWGCGAHLEVEEHDIKRDIIERGESAILALIWTCQVCDTQHMEQEHVIPRVVLARIDKRAQ